jgi:phosphoglycolate phosphatase
MFMNRLVLFDIDGTLIGETRSHRAAFSRAFREVWGKDADIGIINYPGLTDRNILAEVLRISGVDESDIEPRLDKAMELMTEHFRRMADESDLPLLPGVRETLKELERRGALLGLVTGNVEGIAWRKMEILGLDGHFSFGGFGNEKTDREGLVIRAVEKARMMGFSQDGKVFMVGDTPHDIRAGKAVGAFTVAVATGTYSRKELKKESPDYLLDKMDSEGLVRIVFG